MSKITKVTAGKWELDIEKYKGRYVVRLQNGFSLSLGANNAGYKELIRRVAAGEMDNWINKHCEGGELCTT